MIIKQRREILLFLIVVINIKTTIETKSEVDYYRYLQQFGYTQKIEGRGLQGVLAKSSYIDGILKFQRLYKLPVSLFYRFDKSYELI
jgi:hypothetical protein